MSKHALLVGINTYHLLGPLRYARQDAAAFADALRRFCGFSEQDITVMSCRGEGGLLGLSRYIEHALMNLTHRRDLDLLDFGFWGHGFSPQPGRRYLCGIDALQNDLERTAVSLDVVKAKLAQVQAENTLLVLDCCQNRPAGRSAAAEPMTDGEEAALACLARDIQAAHRRQRPHAIPTVAVLNACREGQRAYEWESRQHGVFTAHLLDGFQQGFGGIASLAAWTADRVAKTSIEIHGQPQIPYITIEGRGDIPLTVGGLAPTTASLPRGQVVVLSEPCLHVDTVPPGAALSVDGRGVGVAPRRIALAAGDHRIRAEQEGFHAWERLIRFDGAGDAELRIELEERAERLPSGWTSHHRIVRAATPSGDVDLDIEYLRNTIGMEFARIPAGEFMMGDTLSPEDVDRKWPGGQIEWYKWSHPRHRVRIGRDFLAGAGPVTRGQFGRFVKDARYVTEAGKKGTAWAWKDGSWGEHKGVAWRAPLFEQSDEHPVVCVSWNDANAFCAWLSKAEGIPVRLPTEAEWEYSARAGSDATTWYWGDEERGAQGRANVTCKSNGLKYYFKGVEDGYEYTSPVAIFQPNAFGLYDVIGNVWEWCEDTWHDSYKNAPSDGSAWLGGESARVVRGGSWRSCPRICRSSYRTRYAPGARTHHVGFRVVVDIN